LRRPPDSFMRNAAAIVPLGADKRSPSGGPATAWERLAVPGC
jgi:hypothetical protein